MRCLAGIFGLVLLAGVCPGCQGRSATAQSKNPVVVIETSKGSIEVEMLKNKAPKSVENFLAYAKDGTYAGTIFHRVIDGFMIQGGGFDEKLVKRQTRPPVVNESKNGASNRRGTVAMARTSDPNSATNQFFINVADNKNLDWGGFGPGRPGYTVFGQVTQGMETVDAIRIVATQCSTKKPGPCDRQKTKGMSDVPVEPVKIIKVSLKES